MKKCAYSLIFFLALIMVACSNRDGKGRTNENANVENATKEAIQFAVTDTTARIIMDTLESNSPCYKINISLSFAQGNGVAENNINSGIIYAAFGLDSMSTQEAISTALDTARDEYMALRPKYINEKSMSHSPAWLNYEFTLNGKPVTGYNGCINYHIENYTYTGGAHGLENCILLNFDSKSGKEIKLQDFFAENYEEQLTALLLDALRKQLGITTTEEINEKGYPDIENFYPTENFLLAPDSIIFIYNRYDIAPYSTGRTRIALGYNQIESIIKK